MSNPNNRPGLSSVLRKLLVVAGFAFALLTVILVIYPWGGLLPSALVMVATTIMLVRAYSLGYRYRCGACGKGFRVPLVVDVLTMSGIAKNPDGTYYNWKSLTCPHCGERSKAVVVVSPVADPKEHNVWAGDQPADRGSEEPVVGETGGGANASRKRKRKSGGSRKR